MGEAVPESETLLYQIKQLNSRFERVEKQLDDVRTAIVQMARTEERVSTVLEQNTVLFAKVGKLTQKVHDLEKENATQGQSLNVFERLGWIMVTALVGLGAWWAKQ